MFKIYNDGKTLWSSDVNNLSLLSPTVNLEVNKVGSLSFKILPIHPFYNTFEKMKSTVTVVQDNRIIFKGRVYSDSEDFRRIKTVQVEGILGYLNDSIIRDYSFSGSPHDYLAMLLDRHNAQVEEYQRFKLGRVTVVDNNDYITRSSTLYPSTWSEIETKLISNMGGYIVVRYEDDGNYIDYLADYEDTSTQPISFAVNLLDITQKTDGEKLSTCIIPRGKTDDTTGERVDIKSVNNGIDYVFDANAVAKYGRIYEVVTWDDVALPSNLLNKAMLYLADKIKLTTQITVKALDLHLSDETIESFKLGDYVRVYSKPHGIDDRVLLTAYKMDLSKPAECTITLGFEKDSFIKATSSATNYDTLKKEVGESVKKDVGTVTDSIKDQVLSETYVYVSQTVDNSEEMSRELLKDYVTVGTLDTVKNSISTKIEHNSDEVNLSFNRVNERITRENGEILNHIEEIKKYIRFSDGDIILGEVGNKLTTKISNGRISFLYNESLEVAYISDNKLYITQAEILDRIVIGNFAFIPRTNGNLSFKKV